MKHLRPNTLKTRITTRLIVMQLIFVTLAGILAAIPFVRLSGDAPLLDEGTVWEIAGEVERAPDGSLALKPGGSVEGLLRDYPTFWFRAVDPAGNSISAGPIPAQLTAIVADLSHIVGANIGDTDDPLAPTAIVRPHKGPSGDLRIITGGGPQFGPASWNLFISNRIFVSFAAFLSLAMMASMPWIIRSELRGLEKVAAEAERIDVDQRGMRLSEEKVPGEMRALVRAVNAALKRIDEGFERRQRFLADAAHELRTPIAILQTRIDLLPQGEERHRLLLDVARLSSMADQLLDLQRLDADHARFQNVDLVELAANVTADMAPLVISAGSEIGFESEAESVFAEADAPSLSRALTNLVQNAIAHGGRNGTITVAVDRDGSLRVSDTGPGVAPEHREKIFEPFHRVRPLDKGAGLGLKLVQDIVDRHGGRVMVSDAEGGGAVFEIRLPVRAAVN